MNENGSSLNHTAPAPSPDQDKLQKRFCLKVLGVGGAGCNAINYLARETMDGVTFAALNTDSQALQQSAVEQKLVLGGNSMRGIGAGGDPARGAAAAEEDHARIAQLCDGADLVLVIAGLGGGTGSGAAPVVARLAREKGALVLGIVFLPFDFEGARRQALAEHGRTELQRVADAVICLPNQKIFKLVDEKTSVREAFGIINELVAQGLRGIWRLLSRPGLINLDFADLCAATRGKHSQSALASAAAQGENRARDVIDKLLAHPLIDAGQVLAESTSLLVSITGGPDLTMADITRIMEPIHRQAEQAQIIMGASIEEDWQERLAVTIVASKRAPEPVTEPEEVAPASRFHTSFSPAPSESLLELEKQLEPTETAPRPLFRFVPPPPPLTPERTDQILSQQSGHGGRQRKSASRLRQGQLPLEIISKGRFEKSEPTLHQGQDLDVPTYIRRGVPLN